MASAYIYFDKRRSKEDQTYPILIRICHLGDTLPIKTKLSCTIPQWDEGKLSIKTLKKDPFPNCAEANQKISNLKDRAINYINANEKRLPFITCKQLRDEIEKYDPNKENNQPTDKDITIGTAIEFYEKFLRNENVPEHRQHNRNPRWLKDNYAILDVLKVCIGKDTPIRLITDSHAGKYYTFVINKKKKDGKTITSYRYNAYVDCVSRFFEFLVNADYPCKNPFKHIERRSSKTKPKMALMEEYHQVLDKIDNGNHICSIHYNTRAQSPRVLNKNMYRPWLKTAIKLALLGGGRRAEELVMLKWIDVLPYKETGELLGGLLSYNDYKVERILNKKLGDEKEPIEIPITPQLATLLLEIGWKEKKGKDEYIIAPQITNRAYVNNSMCKGFKHYYLQIENPRPKISFKSLRKTYITYLKAISGDRAKEITGHTTDKIIGDHYEDSLLINKRVVEHLHFEEKKPS